MESIENPTSHDLNMALIRYIDSLSQSMKDNRLLAQKNLEIKMHKMELEIENSKGKTVFLGDTKQKREGPKRRKKMA